MIGHCVKMGLCAGAAGLGLLAMGMPAQAGSNYYGGNDYGHHNDYNNNYYNDYNHKDYGNDKDWNKDCDNPSLDLTCFDLDNRDCGRGGNNESSFTFTQDGITLTVTAFSIDDHGNSHVADVNQDSDGLGVDNGNDNSNDVDNSGWTDILTFTFSAPVTVHHLEFADVDLFDQARVLDASGDKIGDLYLIQDFFDWGNINVDNLTFALKGTTFQFTLPNGSDCWGQDYRIKGICVTNTVPTPGAAGAGLAMLGGLLMRRRRRLVA